MKYKFVILLVGAFLITSCGSQPTQLPVAATLFPSPLPSVTSTPAPTLEPTKPPTPFFTSTPTFPTYPVKEVLFQYGYSGGDFGIFDGFVSPHIPKLILYSDGLLIITKNDILFQKKLSEDDIHSFLSQIEQRGFSEIETDQQHDPTDKLYTLPVDYVNAFDARYLCVSTQTKKICAYEPLMEYVIPSMKSIFNILDGYFPTDMAPYEADRILLSVEEGTDTLPEELRPAPMEWPADLSPLQETPVMFVDGENAAKIFELFDHSTGSWRIMTLDDQEYTVFVRPVLPHEAIDQP
jgi:hypothetical protein